MPADAGRNQRRDNALVRLAEAVSGFVREALEGESSEIIRLFEQSKANGALLAL